MLLELPPELIQLVLQHSTTPTYIQLAFSCCTLLEIASTCREVILLHLRRTPGLDLDVKSSPTRDLFRLLVKRSIRQLYGAQYYATRKVFGAEGLAIDARASAFATPGNPNLALVYKGDESVRISHAHNGNISPVCCLKPPWGQPGRVEVLKTAFDGGNGIYILQRFTPSIDEGDVDEEQHPFVKHALRSGSNPIVYLAHHGLEAPDDGVRVCAFPEHTDYVPLGLAAADRDTFAISWQHARDSGQTEVVLYTILQESTDEESGIISFSYKSRVLLEESGEQPNVDGALTVPSARSGLSDSKGPVIDLAFNDRNSQLLYYYRGWTLYGSFQKINTSSDLTQPTLYSNSCTVHFSDSLSLRFSIAIPFFGTHQTYSANNTPMCHWKYLSFGIARQREENWTVACILKSEARCRARHCGHELNLDRGRRFPDWTIVGLLRGYQDPTSSLGCIVAGSARGTRLAIANWNMIYVWALEPNALIEENKSGFYPPYFQSANTDMIELQPIILHLDAVCFKLIFTDEEDELLAITDRGVMYWDLGPSGKGEQTYKLDL